MMRELPKELTAELLSLVFSRETTNIEFYEENSAKVITYRAISYFDGFRQGFFISADSLTRQMKEWCGGLGYDVLTCVLSNNKSWCQLVEMKTDTFKGISQYFHSKTEFEAVLKATHWVAKTKGLI